MARVLALNCYPIKGCAGTSVPDTVATPTGLRHDRSFMVTGEDGVFRSQRRDPRLAIVRPEIGADGARLTLRAPGVDTLHVEVATTAERREVRLFGVPYSGIDQGDAAADWLSGVLRAPSRLVRVPPEHDRVTDGETPGRACYADSGALLLTSQSSLDLLNDRMVQRGADPLPMNRFRPNIVVDGWDEPHQEDTAGRISVGAAELAYSKLAIRCAVTLVDQDTGVKEGPEPLRTLGEYRRGPDGGVVFGAKFAIVRTGKVSVGDWVDVTRWVVSD